MKDKDKNGFDYQFRPSDEVTSGNSFGLTCFYIYSIDKLAQ